MLQDSGEHTPSRVLRRENVLLTTASAAFQVAHRGGMPGETSFLSIGLSIAAAILLATKFYFVRELLLILAALAVLFAVGTGAVLLLVLLQEGARWSIQHIVEAKRRIGSLLTGSQDAAFPELHSPDTRSFLSSYAGTMKKERYVSSGRV